MHSNPRHGDTRSRGPAVPLVERLSCASTRGRTIRHFWIIWVLLDHLDHLDPFGSFWTLLDLLHPFDLPEPSGAAVHSTEPVARTHFFYFFRFLFLFLFLFIFLSFLFFFFFFFFLVFFCFSRF